MLAGNSTEIWATWTGVPPGCTGEPLWFRWGISGGYAGGNLSASEGPAVNFTASAEQSGTTRVEVRSALVLNCATSRQTAIRDATSNLTVVGPLALEDPTLSPNPVAVGSWANLSTTLANGEPPYRLRVEWGDGNVSFYNVTQPGPVSFPHLFPAGSFTPTIFANDAAGLVANGSVEEPIAVSGGLAVAVDTPTSVAEVGVPVEFSGVVLHAPQVFGYLSACSDSVSGPADYRSADPTEENFSCTFAAPGVAEVDFQVDPVGGDLPPVQAQLMELVVPPLGLNVSFRPINAEVGVPTVVTAQVVGGVVPFNVFWSMVGNSSRQERTCYADGLVELRVWPSQAGSYAVTVGVVDAVGVLVENGSTRLEVDPALQAAASADRVLSPQGASVEVAGTVTSGAPPFQWWVVSALYPSNQSASNGSLDSVAPFGWTGVFPIEGNSSVSVLLVDQYGAAWSTTSPVALVPGMTVTARAIASSADTGPEIVLNVSIAGGLPPFQLNLTTSHLEAWNRSVATDGTSSWTVLTNDSGTVELQIRIRDGVGVVWAGNQSVTFLPSNSTPAPLPAAPSGEPGGSAWVGPVGIVVLLSLAGAAILLWRRRKRSAQDPAPEPDPIEVLRRIVEPAEGAERSTVELLAEEAGVSPDVVRSTVDRLISAGTLRAESGPDGEEVLAWSDPG